MRTTAHAALHHEGGTRTVKSVSREWQFARHRRYASEKPMRMCTSRMCNDNDRTDEAKAGPFVTVCMSRSRSADRGFNGASELAKKSGVLIGLCRPTSLIIKSGMLSRTGSKNIETRRRVMLRNLLFTAAVAAIVAPVVMTTNAMAGSSTSTEIGKRYARSAAHSAPQHHRRHAAHRTFTHRSNEAAAYYSVRPKVSVFHGPGYVYVPGKGIVDEACNLPTSACPNEMREVQ
jgi:hypothetical protein